MPGGQRAQRSVFGLILYRQGGLWSLCCNFCFADREWWLTTWAAEETGKWVMLTLFATFNWCVPVASQSKHSSYVFPWRFLMLDESATVVDHPVCVKPLPAKLSTTYQVCSTLPLGFFVSIWIMVLVLLNVVNQQPRCFRLNTLTWMSLQGFEL